tara:strand:- start:6180 stop:6356 length:177 start_codon:yes stop_codon:yes gene_type:complete
VIKSLESTNNRLSEIDTTLRDIERDLAVLKTKMYAAAAIAALVFTTISTVAVEVFVNA